MTTKVMTVVMVALAASACSRKESEPDKQPAAGLASTAPGHAEGAAFDPCGLLTRDEAQAILGEPVAEGRRDEPVAGRIMACSYAASGAGSSAIVIVQVQKGTRASLDDDLAGWKAAMEDDIEIERLDVAGVPAAWLPASRELRAFDDGWLIIVSATKTKDERASATTVLEKVLPRLPG